MKLTQNFVSLQKSFAETLFWLIYSMNAYTFYEKKKMMLNKLILVLMVAWNYKREKTLLTLSQISPGFYVSAVLVF